MSAHVQRVKKLPSKTTVTLKPPHLLVHDKDEIEVSAHVAPRAVLRELQQVFGGKITFEAVSYTHLTLPTILLV